MITRVPPRLAVRCALFSVFVGVGRFSGVNKIGRLFGGASLWGFALGLRLRASPSGFAFGLRLRARPNPRIDSEPMGDARGRSRIPHKTPTAHRGRICRATPPCGVLERFLLHLLCFTSGGGAVMNAKGIMLDYEDYFTILLTGISGIFVNNLPLSS